MVGRGGEAMWMDAREGTGEERAPESRSKLISLARGVPGLSETALLAFNLLLDTAPRGSEQGGIQSQALLCGLLFFWGFFFLATTRRLGNY